jgi:translocation and assembly module TamB
MLLNRVLRYLKYLIISLVILVMLILIGINLPFVQPIITTKANSILAEKKLPVHVDRINFLITGRIGLSGVEIINSNGDTIVYAKEIKVSVKIIPLIFHKVDIMGITIENATVNIKTDPPTGKLNIISIFSSGEKPASNEKSSGKKWDISISSVYLSKVRFTMDDSVNAIYINAATDELSVILEKFSLTERQIYASYISLRNANGTISRGESVKSIVVSGQSKTQWAFKLKDSDLNKIHFILSQPGNKQKMEIDLAKGVIYNSALDLGNKNINVGKIDLDTPVAEILSSKTQQAKGNVSKDPTDDGFPGAWKITGEDLRISEGSFLTGPYPDKGVQADDSSFKVTELNCEFRDVRLSSRLSRLSLAGFSFALGNGVRLEKGDLTLVSDSTIKTTLRSNLTTSLSHINLTLEAGSGLNELLKSYRSVPFSLKIDDTEVSATDFLAFFPQLANKQTLKERKAFRLALKCDISGDGDQLNIGYIDLTTWKGASLSFSGNIEGFKNPSSAKCSVKFKTGAITPAYLREILLVAGSDPAIPDFDPVTIEGSVDSNLNKPNFCLQLDSKSGMMKMEGNVDLQKEGYKLKMSGYHIDLGKFSGVNDLGIFTGSLDLHGKGFDVRKMKLDLFLAIDTAGFRDYNYTGVSMNLQADEGSFGLKLKSGDPSFKCDLSGSLRFDGSFAGGKFGGLFEVDAGKLHLFPDLAARGGVEATFDNSGKNFSGSLSLKDLILTKNYRREGLNNIFISILSTDTLLMGKIRSDFLNAEASYKGTSEELKRIFNEGRFKGIGLIDSAVSNRIPYTRSLNGLNMSIESTYDPVIGLFLNDTVFSYHKFNLKLANDTMGIVRTEISADRIRYRNSTAYGIIMNLTALHGKSGFNLKADSLKYGDIHFTGMSADLTSSGGKAFYKVTASDLNNHLLYDIGGEIYKDNNEIRMRTSQPVWIINGSEWEVSQGDFLVLESGKSDFKADLHWKNDTSSIDISGQKSDKISFACNKLWLSMLKVPGLNTYGLDGELTGRIEYAGNMNTRLDIQMYLNQFKVQGNMLGKVSVSGNYSSDTTGTLKSDLRVTLNDSSKLSLLIRRRKDAGQKSLQTEFSRIPLTILESVAGKVVNGIHGEVSGGITMTFPGNKPLINGTVRFSKVDLKIVPLNARFYLSDEVIKIENDLLKLNRFTVMDSLRKKLDLNGVVDMSDFKNITADLEVTSDHLQVMNTNEKDNESFNGSIFVNTHLSISGPVKTPVISGKIALAAGTIVNYQYKENLNISETEKIVTFTSRSDQQASDRLKQRPENQFSKSPNIKASIEIDPESQFNFQISKGYDISVGINGGGFLNYILLPNNTISLNGTYEIRKGNSTLKIPGWPRKDFNITPGSYVRWSGAVDDPELHIETTSKVRGSYINPVDDKTREVDFIVSMKLANKLADLEIIFDVGSNDQYITSVFNTLSADERMKQAINLLIFERIDLPNLSSSSAYVSQQINQFWESQINRFTKSAIKNVDLSFGIDTYTGATGTGGAQTYTSLSYKVKKDMFHERGSVLVSGRMNDASSAASQTNTVIENFIFEYAIDSNRTKFLKVYRKNDYEDLLEGEVVKSGVGFIYRKSYDRLKDIWRKPQKASDKTKKQASEK